MRRIKLNPHNLSRVRVTESSPTTKRPSVSSFLVLWTILFFPGWLTSPYPRAHLMLPTLLSCIHTSFFCDPIGKANYPNNIQPPGQVFFDMISKSQALPTIWFDTLNLGRFSKYPFHLGKVRTFPPLFFLDAFFFFFNSGQPRMECRPPTYWEWYPPFPLPHIFLLKLHFLFPWREPHRINLSFPILWNGLSQRKMLRFFSVFKLREWLLQTHPPSDVAPFFRCFLSFCCRLFPKNPLAPPPWPWNSVPPWKFVNTGYFLFSLLPPRDLFPRFSLPF